MHKETLAVVVADVEVEGEYEFERRRYGSNPEQLRLLAEWLTEQQVEEVAMESTAQYWKPVWGALEQYWKPNCQKQKTAGPKSGTLHLAQALSNRGRRGRKKDFPDAERLVKRLVANELVLSFVPDAEQRLWRTVTKRKYQLTRDKVRLQNQLEAFLEEVHIKLSSLVSDLLGVSARCPWLRGRGTQRLWRLWQDLACDASTVVRCARRVRRAQTYLSPTTEDVSEGIAANRTRHQPTRPGDRQSAQPTPRCD